MVPCCLPRLWHIYCDALTHAEFELTTSSPHVQPDEKSESEADRSIKMAGSHGNVNILTDDSQFQPELKNAGSKLVVVDFHATWYDKKFAFEIFAGFLP